MRENSAYALITGASAGLGSSFSYELASRGYNLFLVSLPHENLASMASFIRTNYGVEVIIFETDLTLFGAAEVVLKEINEHNIQIGMLINNAGLGQNQYFEQTDEQYLRSMIELNCLATVSLTHALIPKLKQQPKSYIINISSMGGFFALPGKSVYAASKGFIIQFSQSLKWELEQYGINVSVVCPGGIITNTDKYLIIRDFGWLSRATTSSAKEVSVYALNQSLKGKHRIIPGRLNRFLFFINGLIPAFIRNKLLAYSMKHISKREQQLSVVDHKEDQSQEAHITVERDSIISD